MKDLLVGNLHESLDSLHQIVAHLNNPADLDGLVAQHFELVSHSDRSIDWRVFCEPHEWLQNHDVDLSQAPQLAILGLLLTEQVRRRGYADAHYTEIFVSNTAALRHRRNVFSAPNSWVLQPHVVFGISLGVTIVRDESISEWFKGLVSEGCSRTDTPLFLQLLYQYISVLVGLVPTCGSTVKIKLDDQTTSLPELALAIWLVKNKVMLSPQANTNDWLKQANSLLLNFLSTQMKYQTEDYKASIILNVATVYIDRWSRAVTELADRLVLIGDSTVPVLRESNIDDATLQKLQQDRDQSTQQRRFLIRVSIWLSCVVVVLSASMWLTESLSLWLSCSVAIAGLGVIIFLPLLLERSWFANPARRFVVHTIGTVALLAVCWALLDPTQLSGLILSVGVAGIYTIVQVRSELARSS